MSGFPLDTLKSPTPFDLLPLPPRAEPRSEDSFEGHLRRSDAQSPSRRSEEPRPTTPEAKPSKSPDGSSPPRRETEHSDEQVAKEPGPKSAVKAKDSSDDKTESDEAADTGSIVGDVRQTLTLSKEEISGDVKEAEESVPVLADEKATKAIPSVLSEKLAADSAPIAVDKSAGNAEEEVEVASDAQKITDGVEPDAKQLNKEKGGTPGNATLERATATGLVKNAESRDAENQPIAEGPAQSPTAPVEAAAVVESEGPVGKRDYGSRHHDQGENDKTGQVDRGDAQPSEATLTVAAATQPAEIAVDPSTVKSSDSESRETHAIRSDPTAGPAPFTGRLPQHLIARGATEHAAADKPLTEADQARFVHRVARAFQTAAGQDGELKLRLSPPELGSLRLEVKVQGGVMSARIETENNTTRSLLMENLPALRERLAEQNIRIEQFDIDLTNRQGGGSSSGPAQDQGRQSGGSADAVSRFRAGEASVEEPSVPQVVRRGGETQLNVLV